MRKGQMTEEHKRKLHEGTMRYLLTTKGKPKKVKATLKQIKTLQMMNQGMSKRKAMLKAGYSLGQAQIPNKVFFRRKGVQQMIADMGQELVNQGLTTKYMAQKFAQWMEAEKTVSGLKIKTEDGKTELTPIKEPDYQMQLAAYKEWKKVLDNELPKEEGLQVKRKLTIEEYIRGDKKKEKIIDARQIDEENITDQK